MPDPLLTIETVEPDRPTIAIDRQLYELAVPDDFGLIESARLARLMRMATEAERKVEQLPADQPLDDKAVDVLEAILDGTLAMIVRGPVSGAHRGLPPGIRLTSSQKLSIIEAFTPAVANRTAPPPEAADRSTSARRSPSSKRHTGRRTGTGCRSGSSGRTSKPSPTSGRSRR